MASMTTWASDGATRLLQITNATQPGDPTPASYTEYDPAGNVATQRPLTSDEAALLANLDIANAQAVNQSTLRTQAQNALAANRAYLGIASPTTAQAVAQVKALTQQVQALIRFALDQFDATN